MDFKKCLRCGCFFVSNDNVCCNCAPKDKFEISKLKNYFDANGNYNSIEELSVNTGITINNLNRFISGENLPKETL
jgi:hypothetical protein